MKLYLLYRCPFAHRATIVLQEKGLAFEPVFFQVGKRPPELEGVGPNAKSPTLLDGDARVWDSQIVIDYIEDRYPTPPLLPAHARERAEARMLASQVTQELFPYLGAVVKELHFKPQPDQAKVDEAKSGYLDALGAWDRRLAGRTFLMGDALSLADVVLYTPMHAMRRDVDAEVPAALAHLRAWHDRMVARPSTKLLEPS